MDTRIGIDRDAQVVTVEADRVATIFELAGRWLADHGGTLLGVDYDYDRGDPSVDDATDPRPHVLRLTVITGPGPGSRV